MSKDVVKKVVVKTTQSKKHKQKKKGSLRELGAQATIASPISKAEDVTSYFKVGKSNRVGGIKIHAQDFLKSVTLNNTANTVVDNVLLCPTGSAFAGTRLWDYGQLYEKYVFRKLRFHWQSACPTTNAGTIILAYDRDMADATPENSVSGMRQLLGFMGSKMRNVWESFSIDCNLSDPQVFYYTNDTGYDGRLTTQGQVYLAVVNQPTNNSVGNLWIEYEIELFDPQIATDYTGQMILSSSGFAPPQATTGTANWGGSAAYAGAADLAVQTAGSLARTGYGIIDGVTKTIKMPAGTYEILTYAGQNTTTAAQYVPYASSNTAGNFGLQWFDPKNLIPGGTPVAGGSSSGLWEYVTNFTQTSVGLASAANQNLMSRTVIRLLRDAILMYVNPLSGTSWTNWRLHINTINSKGL